MHIPDDPGYYEKFYFTPGDLGFKSAFIVSFLDNKRINLQKGIKLAENEYFLVGDNRDNSFDSRMFGPISKDRIIGKAYLKIYPFSEFKNLND